MAEATIEVHEEAVEEKERNPMAKMVHKVLLASFGAVALAQDEIEDFVQRLIDRGEIAEKDGRKMLNDVVDRRKKQLEKAEGQMDDRIEEVLHRMNVPTKADIDALSRKISTLTKKVDELKKA